MPEDPARTLLRRIVAELDAQVYAEAGQTGGLLALARSAMAVDGPERCVVEGLRREIRDRRTA